MSRALKELHCYNGNLYLLSDDYVADIKSPVAVGDDVWDMLLSCGKSTYSAHPVYSDDVKFICEVYHLIVSEGDVSSLIPRELDTAELRTSIERLYMLFYKSNLTRAFL